MTSRLVVLCLLLAAPAAAQKPKPLPKPDLKEWSLPNGLTVEFLEVKGAPVVTVQVFYHVGSKDEPRDRRGSAHMFEHMMFKGTEHVPAEEHARDIDRLGGSVNAYTTEDMTAYHDTLPARYMDFAVQLEAERMRNLVFRPSMVKTEKEVVKEEIRLRFENDPILSALLRFRELAFTKHPYAWTAGGTIPDLDKTTPEDLKRFYDVYYRPNNATLVIVGAVSEADARASAEKWFGPIPRTDGEIPRPAAATPEPKQEGLRREVAQKPTQVGIIIGGYKIPEGKHPDLYALSVLASVLSDGESSRLHRRVVRKDKVGVAAGAQIMEQEDPGLFIVFGAHLAPDQAEKLEAAILDEIAKVQAAPVTAAELTKAKNQLAARFVFGLEDVTSIGQAIGQSKILRGDARAWMDAYDKYLAVTAADVQRVAKTYLVKEQLTVIVIPPPGGAP